MAQVNYFFSTIVSAGGDRAYTAANSATLGDLNQGTSTNLADAFEFRVSTGVTGYTNPTKRDIINFLRLVERWVLDQGGSSTNSGQGLDYLITATSGTVGIP
jgi:hypothetical protein